MRRKINFLLVTIISFLYIFLTNSSFANTDKNTPSILFVGNSYTYYNNLPKILSDLSKTINAHIDTHHITFGGATLKTHWQKGKALNEIQKNKWDYIVFQGQSTSMLWKGGINSFDLHLYKFINEIQKTNSKVILFSTWPRKEGNSYYNKTGTTYYKALEEIQNNYYKFAKKYNTGIIYTGSPFDKAKKLGINTYTNDGSHPNIIGSYIVAVSLLKKVYLDPKIECKKVIKVIKIDKKTCESINSIFAQ
jgi:hypothetical protein